MDQFDINVPFTAHVSFEISASSNEVVVMYSKEPHFNIHVVLADSILLRSLLEQQTSGSVAIHRIYTRSKVITHVDDMWELWKQMTLWSH